MNNGGLINCTGMGALELAKDKAVFPTRGQVTLVRAPWYTEKRKGTTRQGPDLFTYIIARKSKNVILGGQSCPTFLPLCLAQRNQASGTLEHDDWCVFHFAI